MELKDWLLIALAFLGWLWGILQYFINRKQQRRVKMKDKRFEVYSGYMKKSDEIINNIRTDPNMFYGIPTDLFSILLTGDEKEVNQAFIDFNIKLNEFLKKTVDSFMILNSELSGLLLVCSNELQPLIEQYKFLSVDFNNEFHNILGLLSKDDTKKLEQQLNTIGHDKRWEQIEALNIKILKIMRKELGSDKQ